MTENKLKLYVEVTEEGSNYKASGNMTAGLIKLIIGELEVIKSRLIYDLENSLKDGYEK